MRYLDISGPLVIMRLSCCLGMPALWMSCTAFCAIRQVCSAHLATTVLPQASAAVICPVKIASGKFQGEIQSTIPRGLIPWLFWLFWHFFA